MRLIFLVLLFNFLQGANLEELKIALEKEFKNNFPKIIISQIDLKTTSLPKDFEQYQFLRIASARFNQTKGFLRAEYKTPQNISKNVFFRYFIKADLEVLRSKRLIKKGEKLSDFHYENVLIDFDKIPLNALSLDDVDKLTAKSNIHKNTLLKSNMFKTTALIHKNDPIIGILSEANVDIVVELIALQNANMGEKIRAKNKEGKIIQGIVIGKNKMAIQ